MALGPDGKENVAPPGPLSGKKEAFASSLDLPTRKASQPTLDPGSKENVAPQGSPSAEKKAPAFNFGSLALNGPPENRGSDSKNAYNSFMSSTTPNSGRISLRQWAFLDPLWLR